MLGKKTPHPQTCERCPHRYRAEGCPCWVTHEHGFMETNEVTGDTRPVTGCFYQVMPKLLSHVVTAGNRTAAAVCSTRNEIASGFTQLCAAAPLLPLLEDKRG